MNRKALRPEHVWLLIGATALVALLIGIGSYAATRYHASTDLMSQIEPRFARLAGLRSDGVRLRTTEQALSANLARLAYGPEGDPAQTGNAALQQLRTAMASRGLQVSSSQVLPAREEGDFLRIGLNLRVDGELGALSDFLRDMAQIQAPVIFSESVQLSAQPFQARTQNVSAQLNLFVLKVRP
ncbi:type II secretion system protein M [bacterium BD-1]|nr:type II secretion system protein M [Ottowia caeni]